MYAARLGVGAIVRARQTCEFARSFRTAHLFQHMVFLGLQILHGAAVGSLYGLFALALGLLTRRNVPPNPALAAIATLAALTVYRLADRYDMPLLLTLPVGMALGGGLAVLVEVLTVAPLGRPGVLRHTPFAALVTALAAWVALDAVASLAAGPDGVLFPPESYPATVFGTDDTVVRLLDGLIGGLAVAAVLAVRRVLATTLYGTALRAIRYDAQAAAIGGVSPRRKLLLAALGAGALAGLAGILAALAASQAGTPVTVTLGQSGLWKALAVLVLSGCALHETALHPGRLLLLGALLGAVEAVCGAVLPQWMPLTPWQGAAAAALLALAVARPQGLLVWPRAKGAA